MKDIPCLCGNDKDFDVVYEQNFTEDMLSPGIFSARGKHDFEAVHCHYRILRCKRCSQMYSSPVLEPEKIEELYFGSRQDYTDETRNIVGSYLKPLMMRKHFLKGRDAVLEVGCGSGFILEALLTFGFGRIAGVEPGAHAVSQASEAVRPFISNCAFEKTSFEPASFDLLCAFQVVDHFMNPLAVMKEFHEVLKPGGLCYAIIHNEQALQVKILGDKSPIIDVSHIYYFNRKTLKRLFELAGFEVADIFHIWNNYTLKTWLRMLPIPLKSSILKALRFAGLEGLSASVPAGNIGIMGIKK